jgi:arginine-tRNA-protein transferase
VEELTKEKLGEKLKGQKIDMDSDPSDADDTEIPEGSLFDYNIPGVLKKEDVAKLDLDHMKLLVRANLIELEDLRGWEEWQIDDPGTIKGIAAELIAATGPRLLKDSALALF